jgi:hypothetical protein
MVKYAETKESSAPGRSFSRRKSPTFPRLWLSRMPDRFAVEGGACVLVVGHLRAITPPIISARVATSKQNFLVNSVRYRAFGGEEWGRGERKLRPVSRSWLRKTMPGRASGFVGLRRSEPAASSDYAGASRVRVRRRVDARATHLAGFEICNASSGCEKGAVWVGFSRPAQ